ncbi:MAG: hypothetical protein NVSMB21_15300 [Vulcanimicrobiaceae bacterium]
MDITRPRVDGALASASRMPVTLVVAPAGSGKSVAIRQYVASTADETLVFDVRPSHASLSRFVRGFAETLEATLPKVAQSLAIAHERALQSPHPAEVLAAWVAEHLSDAPRTIVVDNFHHCEGNRSIAAFVAAAIERTRATTRWIVATRSAAELPLAIWLARGDADVPLDRAVLDLDAQEASRFAERLAPALGPRLVRRIVGATGGSIGAVVFALATSARDAALAERALDAGGDTHERFIDEVLTALTPYDRCLLEQSAIFPDLDGALLSAAGFDEGAERLVTLRERFPQLFDERLARLTFETLFAELLVSRLAATGNDAVFAARSRAGRALESCERIVEALAYYIGARDFAAIARLLEARGLAFVEAGYGDAIADAIDTLDPIVQNASPAILAMKAMIESRLGRFDLAESWFQLSLERAVEANVRGRITYQYGVHLLRFLRPEAIELLERLAADAETATDLRCYAWSALGPALLFAGRSDEATEAAERALAFIEDAASSHLRARVFHQAAFVALHRNEGERARELASHSLALANEHGFFDIAAGALTVLYNTAADLADDPVESIRVLDAVADCAAKSGSLVNHLLALAAKLEIETERADESAIARLDERLKTLDVRSSGRVAYEALLPSQALRASWAGDYAGAYHLLASTAVLQWSDERKALRWAEVAVFAVAAGRRADASSAIASAYALLDTLEPSQRRTRTQLFLALALILLGRGDAARELFVRVDAQTETLSERMRALRRIVGALAERYRGERNHATLIGLFRALEEHHFGGVARMIQMLPLGDNATARLGELTARERRLLMTLVGEEAAPGERGVTEIVGKLGCIDRRAVIRAVARQTAYVGTRERVTLGKARAR